jgi:hypothetical protein
MLEAMRVDDITPVEVGNGCYRRDPPVCQYSSVGGGYFTRL